MRTIWKVALAGVALLAMSGAASAQAEAQVWGGPSAGLALIGAGLALGLAALGTGVAQSGIGAAVVGAVAEDPGFLGKGFILLAFVETVLIFGFVGLILISGQVPG